MALGSDYRRRFALTLDHKPVDRPPMDLAGTDMTNIDGGPRRLAPALGLPPAADPAEADEAVLVALDIDVRGIGGVVSAPSPLERRISETEVADVWGITYRHNGHHYEAVGRPLAGATLADLEAFPWPDPERIDPVVIQACADRARYLAEETRYVVCGRHPVLGVMELGCWMCGYDDFLERMAAEPEFVHRFFEIIRAYQRRVDALYYGAVGRYLHFTSAGDDFGTQTGPFISPRMFRRMVAPYIEDRLRDLRRYTDAAFFHHSCGAIRELIPDLIEAGVQILNPIQPHAAGMEPDGLKRDFGERVTFHGGIDTQQLLPFGTPEEVTAETRRIIATLGDGGGYILAAAHTIQEDVPAENAVALFRAATP